MTQLVTTQDTQKPLWRKLGGWVLILAFAALMLAEGLTRGDMLAGVERFYGDLWYRLAGQRAPLDKVALIKLDEATLADYPDEPLVFWGPRYAQAAAVLREAGAAVIGFDMLFSASPEQWLAKLGGLKADAARDFDQPFRRELASGKVVVAGMQTAQETLLPAPDYLVAMPDFDAARFVGAADLMPDSDGTLRNFYPSPLVDRNKDDLRLLSLPFLLAVHASQQSAATDSWQFGKRTIHLKDRITLAYAGPPGSVNSLSLRELLKPDALNNPRVQALRGKVVIIGASYGGMNDAHLTPYGRGLFEAPLMLGAEIQAQTVDALLSGRFVDELPAIWRVPLTALLVFPAALLWRRKRPLTGLAILLLPLGVAGLAGYVGFGAHLLVPVGHFQAAAFLAYAAIYGWRFTHGEQERERLRGIFSRYLEPKVVEALLNSEKLPQLGGEQLEMTVLFTDIRNFTTISEQLTAQEVVEMLNSYFGRACAVLAEEGACIDKFIGDAIMAEFGVPLKTPDHARRALFAAIKLKQVADEFTQWMHERFADRMLPEFAIGIGVHTGYAVVGNIGTAQRMEYTAIGDSVNLASRLEGMTKTVGCVILASRDTLESAGEGFTLGKSSTVTVKGRAQAVDVWEILGIEESGKNA
ncbi:MAG: adenylate/guanylate cyclase domain-containing protein [Azonexus sp.]